MSDIIRHIPRNLAASFHARAPWPQPFPSKELPQLEGPLVRGPAPAIWERRSQPPTQNCCDLMEILQETLVFYDDTCSFWGIFWWAPILGQTVLEDKTCMRKSRIERYTVCSYDCASLPHTKAQSFQWLQKDLHHMRSITKIWSG